MFIFLFGSRWYVLEKNSCSKKKVMIIWILWPRQHLILRSLSRWICWFRNFHHYQIQNQFVCRCHSNPVQVPYVRSFLQNYSNQKWNFLVIIYSMFHRKNYLLAIFSVCIFAIVRHSCVHRVQIYTVHRSKKIHDLRQK